MAAASTLAAIGLALTATSTAYTIENGRGMARDAAFEKDKQEKKQKQMQDQARAQQDAEQQKQDALVMRAQSKQDGQRDSILTSPLGVTSAAPTANKTLLGA